MMAHACNPNIREIRRSRKRRGHSVGLCSIVRPCFKQTNKQIKTVAQAGGKKELLLAMTLGSNSLDLLLLNKSGASQTYDQVRSRLLSAACMRCPLWAPVSRQVGSLEEHRLFGASCWFHIHLLYVSQNQIHLKILIPVALKYKAFPGRQSVNFISE